MLFVTWEKDLGFTSASVATTITVNSCDKKNVKVVSRHIIVALEFVYALKTMNKLTNIPGCQNSFLYLVKWKYTGFKLYTYLKIDWYSKKKKKKSK